MKTTIAVLFLCFLAGCSTVEAGIAALPSVQHCQSVQYTRDYGHVRIVMDCAIPPQAGPNIKLPLAP